MTNRPYINKAATVRDDLDPMAAVPVVSIPGRDLRAGMVLVDPELHTPIGEVDHKMRAPRLSGLVAFLMFDFDAHNWTSESVRANGSVKVMAAI
jgi:hypothetical protein